MDKQDSPAGVEGELADEEGELADEEVEPRAASDRLSAHPTEDSVEEDEDDDEDARLKGHRGIPSWDDAIGFIVGANMRGAGQEPDAESRTWPRRPRSRASLPDLEAVHLILTGAS